MQFPKMRREQRDLPGNHFSIIVKSCWGPQASPCPTKGRWAQSHRHKDRHGCRLPWTAILNVIVTTMAIYTPKEHNTGAAIWCFLGEGRKALAIDLEGEEVCDWITAKGMNRALVKYRVPQAFDQ
jgi:hypothetical protein